MKFLYPIEKREIFNDIFFSMYMTIHVLRQISLWIKSVQYWKILPLSMWQLLIILYDFIISYYHCILFYTILYYWYFRDSGSVCLSSKINIKCLFWWEIIYFFCHESVYDIVKGFFDLRLMKKVNKRSSMKSLLQRRINYL